mmetsp:Transcript_51294/g.100727  ORF Transcript_51294/g.100727 Transcript_51294/m.100727 type:complete len:158 (+) Transcript_51294:446-919(+)
MCPTNDRVIPFSHKLHSWQHYATNGYTRFLSNRSTHPAPNKTPCFCLSANVSAQERKKERKAGFRITLSWEACNTDRSFRPTNQRRLPSSCCPSNFKTEDTHTQRMIATHTPSPHPNKDTHLPTPDVVRSTRSSFARADRKEQAGDLSSLSVCKGSV